MDLSYGLTQMYKTYFTAKPILSKGAIINAVFSERSDGKTYDCKARAIENFEKDGSTLLYVRRWKTEICEKMYSTFMNEWLRNNEEYLMKYDFNQCKTGVQIKLKSEKKFTKWLIYFMPLTMAGKMKSTIDIHNIHEIDFDEYIPLDGRYMQEEMHALLELYNSIDRERFTTKLLILGNKVTLFNPLFNFFDLNFNIEKRGIRTYKDGTLAIEIYANDEHRAARQKSPFFALIKGTQYEKYMFGDVLDKPTIRIMKIPENATLAYAYKTILGCGTLYMTDKGLIVSNKTNNGLSFIVDQIYDIPYKQYTIQMNGINSMLKSLYRQGFLFFEDNKAYAKFEPILRSIK